MNAATDRNTKDGRFGKFGTYALRAGVLALGLMMLTGCKNQQHEDQVSSLNAEIATLQDEKSQLASTNSSLQSQLAAAQAQAQAQKQPPANPMNDQGDTGQGGPRRGNDQVTIEVAGDVLFASGQVTLKPESKKDLDRVASRLKSEFSGRDIRVEGYTDSDPIKKSKYPSNEALSQARAEAVESYLISKGIPSNRISSVGRGSAKQRATKAASRRVEIVVLGN